MAVVDETNGRATKVAAVLHSLDRGPPPCAQAVQAANFLGVLWPPSIVCAVAPLARSRTAGGFGLGLAVDDHRALLNRLTHHRYLVETANDRHRLKHSVTNARKRIQAREQPRKGETPASDDA